MRWILDGVLSDVNRAYEDAKKRQWPWLTIKEVALENSQFHLWVQVKSYCGHGIGELFHCAPNIPHYSRILIRFDIRLCVTVFVNIFSICPGLPYQMSETTVVWYSVIDNL